MSFSGLGRDKQKREKGINGTKNARIGHITTYDPDSKVNSLCLNLESWISSIERAKESDHFSKINEKAGMQLMKRLFALGYIVNHVQEALAERTSLYKR